MEKHWKKKLVDRHCRFVEFSVFDGKEYKSKRLVFSNMRDATKEILTFISYIRKFLIAELSRADYIRI